MVKHLFIGGNADGRWIETDGREVWEVAEGARFAYDGRPLSLQEEFRVQRYWRVPVCENEETLHVYTLRHNRKNVLRSLIAGYRS